MPPLPMFLVKMLFGTAAKSCDVGNSSRAEASGDHGLKAMGNRMLLRRLKARPSLNYLRPETRLHVFAYYPKSLEELPSKNPVN